MRGGQNYTRNDNHKNQHQSVSKRDASYPNGFVNRGAEQMSATSQADANKPDINGKSTRYMDSARRSLLFDVNAYARFAELDSNGRPMATVDEDESQAAPPASEEITAEERRKRREAVKAKYKGHTTPLLVQALEHGSTQDSASPSQQASTPRSTGSGKMIVSHAISFADSCPSASPPATSTPGTPRNDSRPGSPPSFTISNDADLANINIADTTSAGSVGGEDEPSAADYDPTMDMQEDRAREDSRQQAEGVSAADHDEKATSKQDVPLPDTAIATTEKPSTKQPESDDMFASDNEDDDMFAPAAPKKTTDGDAEPGRAVPVPKAKELDMSLMDNWDDHEGYYRVILGELLDGRYQVQANLGKGMFSSVIRTTDTKTNELKAIKVIRNNETMTKAGAKEMDILQTLMDADPEDKKHMIRLERSFTHKGHLCMVFENLSINLREVLKKFGRDCGINLKAVRAYAQQLFLGLSLLRKCNVLHADLKPDNVLVNEERNMLKICDLGSASDASENDITPYLVSRFYRAPEIILGVPYDFALDMWSIGCTLFELYTGKILFTGRTNNQMLKSIMECRGKFSLKLLKKAEFGAVHFDDQNLNFRSMERDKVTGRDVTRLINFQKPVRDLKSRIIAGAGKGDGKGLPDGELKELNLFVDLLDRCLALNPERRLTPAEALKHPFIHRGPGK